MNGLRFSPALLRRRAPGGGWVLLGPGLSLFALDRLPASPASLSPADHETFARLGLVVPDRPPVASPPARRRRAVPGLCGAIAVAPGPRGRAAAALLSGALSAQGGRFRTGPAAVDACVAGEIVVWMGETESLAPLTVVAPLLRRGLRVLWFGETSTGLQVGPLLTSARDVAAYTEATSQWGSAQALRQFGFTDAWPLSLIDRTFADASAVARAIRRVVAEPDSCVLLPSRRVVQLWTAVRGRPVPLAQLRRSQRWPKGLLADLRVERMPGGGFLASCAPPCRGIATLEGCHGKGLLRTQALVTAIGEAIERFSACEAGLSLPRVAPAASEHPLGAFHPIADRRYAAYLRAGASPVPGYPAVDELTGRPTRVPECLVPFPYIAPRGRPGFASDTAGLAAFPERSGAVLRGASEILERHNFYPRFLHQLPAREIGGEHEALGAHVAELVARLGPRARVWLLEYPEAHGLPIVHAFLLDRRAGHLSRGTGAGTTVALAAERALLEALMSRVQHEHLRKNPELPGQDGFRDWARPAAVQTLVAYLDRQPRAAATARPAANDMELLTRIKAVVRAAGVPLLVADLPCPVAGWSAVRVLLPGFTCHAHASDSAGGRVLFGAPLRLQIPT